MEYLNLSDKIYEEKDKLLKNIEETKQPKSEWAMERAGDVHSRNTLEIVQKLEEDIKEAIKILRNKIKTHFEIDSPMLEFIEDDIKEIMGEKIC